MSFSMKKFWKEEKIKNQLTPPMEENILSKEVNEENENKWWEQLLRKDTNPTCPS